MSETTWISDWEMQCCGQPFAIGDEVDWPLSPSPDTEWLETILGERGQTVTSMYEAHSEEGSAVLDQVIVEAIDAIYCAYADQDGLLCPVKDSWIAEHREAADGYEPEAGSLRFAGYVVRFTRQVP